MPKQALIMIDMQRGFLDSASPLCIPAAEGTVPACAALIGRCHEAGVPVIYAVRHYRADGTDVEKPRAAAWASGGKPLSEVCAAHLSDAFPDAFTVLPQDYVLVKPRFSAFFHTGLDLILRRLGLLHKERVPLRVRLAPLRTPFHKLLDLLDFQPRALEALDHAQRLELLLAEAADARRARECREQPLLIIIPQRGDRQIKPLRHLSDRIHGITSKKIRKKVLDLKSASGCMLRISDHSGRVKPLKKEKTDMAKHVLILSASLRAGSNSETLANAFADGARAAGHMVELVSLRGKNIAFCRGCLACQTLGRCVIDDDAVAITDKMQHADVIVFATPIYYYEMSGQLKTLLDRANALFPSDYAFRDIYLLASATEDEPDTDERAIHGLEGWIACYEKCRLAGTVFAGGVTEPGAITGHPALETARAMGAAIA